MRKTVIGGGIALAMALAPAAAFAQDDMAEDMDDGDMMMGAMVPHPSHIHAGDCTMPGDVVLPLSDVGVVGNDAEGAASHVHVDIGLSTVEAPLEAILAEDHSIMVHQSADDLGTILACGSIGGHDVDGRFLVGIGPWQGSSYAGIAWLTDNGDGTTDVEVTLTNTSAMHESMDDDMAMDDDMSDESMDDMDDMSDDDMSDDDMDDDDMDDDDMSDDDMDDDEMSEDG